MTYCVGMQLDAGLMLMSDTRTNAGVDNISVFRKMFSWEADGERDHHHADGRQSCHYPR
jgi:putative proteasome-type protease